jgi:hypothetical protein
MVDELKTIENFHKMMKLVRRFPIRHSPKKPESAPYVDSKEYDRY